MLGAPMFSLPFDQLAIGQRSRSRGRTITETDVVNFCGLTGNWLDIHSDAEFSKTSKFGQRVVQGGLVFVISNALFGFDAKLIVAFYGVDKLRFRAPAFIGDTIHSESEIIGLRPKDEKYGIATARLEAINQRDEVVLSCDFSCLLHRKALPDAEPIARGASA
jgi:acyl dehydratase